MKPLSTILVFALLCSCVTLFAADSFCESGSCTRQPCKECDIQKTCSPEWVKKKVSKSCFETECKEICIPKVRFPWEKCSTPKCGKVITVKVLKKRKYKCDKWVSKWNIFGYQSGCDAGCDNAGQAVYQSDSSPQPPPAPASISVQSK